MRLVLNMVAGISAGLLATAAQAQPGPTPSWDEVFRDERSIVHVDRSSIQRDGATLTLHSRSDLTQEMDGGIKQIFVRFRYDCAARTSDLLWVRLVSADGLTLNESVVPQGERRVEPVETGTPNEAILNRLCT